ncbi:MAG: hypothetical protein J6B60_06095 [Clostridia bacterium]|nr:hypothetical protein [Clostridia bacterium]
MKKILSLLLILCFTFAFVSCKDDEFKLDKDYEYDGVSLVGRWQSANLDHSSYTVYDFEGGSQAGYNNATVSMYFYGIEAFSVKATYRVEDRNILVIDYNENSISTERHRFSISDGRLYIDTGDDIILEKYNLEYNKSNDILGTWRDEDSGVTWKFLSDYTGSVTDDKGMNEIYFSTLGQTLYIFINENILNPDYEFKPEYVSSCTYAIENDTLTLTIGEEIYTLKKQHIS